MKRVTASLHAAESQIVSRRSRMPQHTVVDGAKRIGNCAPGLRAEAGQQHVARMPQFGFDCAVVEPGQPPVRHAMRGEIETTSTPRLDLIPGQMPQSLPGIARIPVFVLPTYSVMRNVVAVKPRSASTGYAWVARES